MTPVLVDIVRVHRDNKPVHAAAERALRRLGELPRLRHGLDERLLYAALDPPDGAVRERAEGLVRRDAGGGGGSGGGSGGVGGGGGGGGGGRGGGVGDYGASFAPQQPWCCVQ